MALNLNFSTKNDLIYQELTSWKKINAVDIEKKDRKLS